MEFDIFSILFELWSDSGISALVSGMEWKSLVMMIVAFVLSGNCFWLPVDKSPQCRSVYAGIMGGLS